jgi:hypothetical protein
MKKAEKILTIAVLTFSLIVVSYGYIHHYIETGKILFIG